MTAGKIVEGAEPNGMHIVLYHLNRCVERKIRFGHAENLGYMSIISMLRSLCAAEAEAGLHSSCPAFDSREVGRHRALPYIRAIHGGEMGWHGSLSVRSLFSPLAAEIVASLPPDRPILNQI